MHPVVKLAIICSVLIILAVPLYFLITLNWIKKVKSKFKNMGGVKATVAIIPHPSKGIIVHVSITGTMIIKYFWIDTPEELSKDLILEQLSGNHIYVIRDNQTSKIYKAISL